MAQSQKPVEQSEPPGAFEPNRKSLLWNIGQTLCRIFTTGYFDLKVFGARHIPPAGGVLIVSNHQSYLDPVLLAVQLDRPMSYLARASLFRNPLFSWLITNLNAVPVRRGEGDVGAVKEIIRRLEEGHMLAMFPEGTRTLTGEIKPLEPGVALVIRRASGIAVVPAVVDGSFEAWPKGSKLPNSRPIRVLYGPPMKLEGLRGNQIIQLIESTLRKMLGDLRAGEIDAYR
jgi:1-acyl-sn-glycerol-3-phosphate acyltransferase